MKVVYVVGLCTLGLLGCEYNFNLTAPSSTSPSNIPSIVNTNTNSTTQSSENGSAGIPSQGQPPVGSSAAPLPLPTYGETIGQTLATANPILLGQSCKDSAGEASWAFLDLLVRTLRVQDVRWGYLCKDSQCLTFGRDVIAYKATSADTGIWIVDVIDDCGTGNTFHWIVHAFDTARPWSAGRIPGAVK